MRSRRGFTLIEVMMSLAIFAAVVLGMASATGSFLHIVTVGDRRASALQLADSRLAQIQLDPNYTGLDTAYAKTENNFPTLTGYIRKTVILHVGGSGQSVDYKKITVTVTGPGLPSPVSRTVTLAAP